MTVSRRKLVLGGLGALASGGAVLGLPSIAEASSYPTLSLGASGSYVTLLQQRLSAATYWLGGIDGSFGSLTQQAVYAIQKAAGISRDGVVGPVTWSKVLSGLRPVYGHSAGYRVEIDKSEQLLKIIRNGALAVTLNTSTGSGQKYISSSGTTAIAYTPTGSYRVYYAVDGMDHGKLGDLWRPRYFNGGIAVHGSSSVPPWPASHGCCRVSNSAMNMIWARNYMPIGSQVYVGN